MQIVGDILYYCDGAQGLRIYLVGPPADPANPALLGVLQIPAYEIAVDGTLAYVTSGSGLLGGDEFQVVDVSVPSAPSLLGAVTLPDIVPDAEPQNVAASGGFAYVGLFGTVAIVDATVPTAPTVIGSLGVIGERAKVALDGEVLFVTQINGIVHAWDVSDPFAPVDIGQAPSGFDIEGITISGDHLYVAGNGVLGIVDISDPANMISTLYFAGLLAGSNRGIDVMGGVGYVIKSDELTVLDLSQPTQPALLGTMPLPTSQSARAFVAARQGFVYASQPEQDAHYIVDVATCPSPPLITTQPQSVVAVAGAAPASFDVAANFFSSIQWRHGVPIADVGPYSGATTTTLTVAPTLGTEGVYDAVIFNGQGSVTSFAAGLVVINSCPADIVSSATFAPPPDGMVDGADLAFLLGEWGLCN